MPTPARLLTHDGETLTLDAWAARKGLSASALRSRLDRLGWPLERALRMPVNAKLRRGGRPKADAVRPAPVMRHHGPSGRAFVRWRAFGGDHCRYLGPWGSDEARQAYRRFVAEWMAGATAAPGEDSAGLGVAELVERWLAWCQTEYTKGGTITSEVYGCRAAAVPLLELYGGEPAAEFGPVQFRAVRAVLVGQRKARKTVNEYMARVIRCFRWAAGQAILPAAVPAALESVERMKPGRGAVDRAKVKDVTPDAVAAAVAKLVPRNRQRERVAAMIEVQRLTGMRPGDLCGMRPCDLDTSGEVWLYAVDPDTFKNTHRGKVGRYWIGPKAQALIGPWLDPARPSDPVFGLTRNAYGLAVRLACDRARIPRWHPHQLRHSLATEVARVFEDVAKAAAVLGDTVEVAGRTYVHVDPAERARIEVARKMG